MVKKRRDGGIMVWSPRGARAGRRERNTAFYWSGKLDLYHSAPLAMDSEIAFTTQEYQGSFLGSWRCPCGSWALLRDALRRYRGREAGELDEENFDMLARHPDHSSAVAVCVHEINSHDHVMWA